MKWNFLSAAVALAISSGPLWASATQITNTGTSSAQTSPSQTDNTERANAQYWGLNLEEYRRYQSLMKGVRGSFSDPKITPIEVLGIHARNDAERKKYAEAFARIMADDTQRILRFQEEYESAFHRLYPGLTAMETSRGNVGISKATP